MTRQEYDEKYKTLRIEEIEKIKIFFLEVASPAQQFEMAENIQAYLDEYGGCDFLDTILSEQHKKREALQAIYWSKENTDRVPNIP